MSKVYADNLGGSNSDSSRGIAVRDVFLQATGRDLTNPNFHYYNKFESFNDWGDRGCRTFVPVLKGDGTKIASPGDIFDPPGEMS